MATMKTGSRFSPYTSIAGSHSMSLSNDKDYLEWRYNKVLGYHNAPGNTMEEIARFARELDEISEMLRAIK